MWISFRWSIYHSERAYYPVNSTLGLLQIYGFVATEFAHVEAMGIAILLLIALVILDGTATSFAVGDDWISFMDQMLMLVPPVFTAFLTTEDLSLWSVVREWLSAVFTILSLFSLLSCKTCLSAHVLDG